MVQYLLELLQKSQGFSMLVTDLDGQLHELLLLRVAIDGIVGRNPAGATILMPWTSISQVVIDEN